MIPGFITIKSREVGESPTGYDILLETQGACGCRYATSFVSYAHDTERRLQELQPHYDMLEHSLRNDRHGDQFSESIRIIGLNS